MIRTLEQIKVHLRHSLQQNELRGAPVTVRARPLTPDEVIGDPEHQDYPLVKGRERMMEASVGRGRGQAYTDMFGHWDGILSDVLDMRLDNNYRRAIFIAVTNAYLQHQGRIRSTLHCRDDEPVLCGRACSEYVLEHFRRSPRIRPRVGLVGYQPRMAEHLAKTTDLQVLDRDTENLGIEIGCGPVRGPESLPEVAQWADLLWVTGTTVVNGTLDEILAFDKPVVLYGVTAAGAATILGLPRFCPYSRCPTGDESAP